MLQKIAYIFQYFRILPLIVSEIRIAKRSSAWSIPGHLRMLRKFQDPSTSDNQRNKVMNLYNKAEHVLDEAKRATMKPFLIMATGILLIVISDIITMLLPGELGMIGIGAMIFNHCSLVFFSFVIIRSTAEILSSKYRFYHYYTNNTWPTWPDDDASIERMLIMIRLVFTPKPVTYPPIKSLLPAPPVTYSSGGVFVTIDYDDLPFIGGRDYSTVDINVDHPLWSDPNVIAHGVRS